MPYTINIVLLGIGNVGSSLINKAIRQRKKLLKQQDINIRFSVIAGSQAAFFDKGFTKYSWETNLTDFPIPYDFEKLMRYAAGINPGNTIIIDTTSSSTLPLHYAGFLQQGFSVITVNKFARQQPSGFSEELILQCLCNNVQYSEPVFAEDDKETAVIKLLDAVAEYCGNVAVI